MGTNKWRGEVAFPAAGKSCFISFPLEDLAELEDRFGEDFFGVIEAAAFRASPKVMPDVLAIGLKCRDAEGAVSKVWDEVGVPALRAEKFSLVDAGKVALDAIAISWLQKTYTELVAEAAEARKKADAETVKRLKEAAEENGIPFDEALSPALSKLLIGTASALSTSGD